jgi:hypothetical protein
MMINQHWQNTSSRYNSGRALIAGSLFIIFLLNKRRVSWSAYLSLLIYGGILTCSAWTGVKGTTYGLSFLLVVGGALANEAQLPGVHWQQPHAMM